MFTDAEVGLSIGFHRDLKQVVANAQVVVDQVAAERDKLAQQVAELQKALLVERAHTAGSVAQARTLKMALQETSKDHALFRRTGKVLPDGRPQTALSLVYDAAFDQRAAALGAKNPSTLRQVAK